MIVWYEALIIGLGLLFGAYFFIWAIPGVLLSAIVSLGDYKYIVLIDRELAKDLGTLYDDKGYMLPKYQLSWKIANRLAIYSILYPLIRKRASTDSVKFKLFMWTNAIGWWSLIGSVICVGLAKVLGIIP